MEALELVILRDKATGYCVIGIATPFGLLPAIIFPDLQRTKNFRDDLSSFIEQAEEKVPPVFLDAFSEDTKDKQGDNLDYNL